MKHLLFTLAVLGTFAVTQSSSLANQAPLSTDRQLRNKDLSFPAELASSATDDVLLAHNPVCYPAPHYRGYGRRYGGPAFYPSYRSWGPYGYGYGAGYRGLGGFGRYSSRYGYGPRSGIGLYIGF